VSKLPCATQTYVTRLVRYFARFEYWKIRLGAYLKMIKAADTAVCQCQRSNETVSHILGHCFQLEHKDGHALANQPVWNVPALLSDSKLAREAVAFMKSTRLLHQFSRC
jgi:hypothetical protein